MALPRIRLLSQPDRLDALAEKLTEHNYQESAIAALLGLQDISELNALEYPAYLWRCRLEDGPLGRLISFFLLNQGMDIELLRELLTPTVVRILKRSRLIRDESGFVSSQVTLYPCLGQFFFTDPWLSFGAQEPGKIYELGTDSYVLARVTPRKKGARCLDLCTGSGIHAVGSAKVGDSTAVDINPRAVSFTKLNASVNGVELEVLEGDLYEPLPKLRYDLITVNPPFVASPDPEILAHRSVGETGEEIPERLVAALPERLAEDGLFSMILDYPVFDSEDYLDRLERWLAREKGWGIAVLRFSRYKLNDFIRRHLGSADYVEKFEAYLESYTRLGIVGMESAQVFIRRLPTEQPNWKELQNAPWPLHSIRDEVTRWLDCLATYHDPEWRPESSAVPRIHPSVKTVWSDLAEQEGHLEFHSTSEFAPAPLSGESLKLAKSLVDNLKSVGELSRDWDEDASLEECLRELGLRRALAW